MAQVEGLMRLMEGEHVGPFNLGNPGEFTMLELAKVNIRKETIWYH
jgi:UDP-glucuronate decarboxylase